MSLHLQIEEMDAEKEDIMLSDLSRGESYYGGQAVTRRYRLDPGRYLLLPHSTSPGEEREFCIRVFSAVPTTCR